MSRRDPLSGGMISNVIADVLNDLGVDKELIKKANLLAKNLLDNIDVEVNEQEQETIFTVHLNKIRIRFKK